MGALDMTVRGEQDLSLKDEGGATDISQFQGFVSELISNARAERALRVAEDGGRRFRKEGNQEGEAHAILLQAMARANARPEDPKSVTELAHRAADLANDIAGDDGAEVPESVQKVELEALKLAVRVNLDCRRGEEAVLAAKALQRRCQQLEDEVELDLAKLSMVKALLVDNRTQEAEEAVQKLLTKHKKAKNFKVVADCNLVLSDVLVAAGDADQAAEVAFDAHKAFDEDNNMYGRACAANKLAHAQFLSGNHVDALRTAELANKDWSVLKDPAQEVDACMVEMQAKMAICKKSGNRMPLNMVRLAISLLEKTLLFRKHDSVCVGEARLVYAQALFAVKSLRSAEKEVAAAAKAFRKARDVRRRAEAVMLWAEVYLERGLYNNARIEANRALELYERLGDSTGNQRVANLFDSISKALGIPTQAELEEQEQLQLQMAMQMAGGQAAATQGVVPIKLQEQLDETHVQEQPGGAAFQREGSVLALSKDMDPSLVTSKVGDIVKLILGDNEHIDEDIPLMEAGITSQTAVILRNELGNDMPGIKLPPTLIFDYPSIAEITNYVMDHVK